MDEIEKQRTLELLKTLRVVPDKAFGQNFVQSPAVIDEIIRFARPESSDRIVEIGPGLGALTAELLSIGEVNAIEIEESFCHYLRKKFSPSLTVHHADIRGFDLPSLGKDLVVFGNIPYSFSSEILFYLIDNAYLNGERIVKRAVLLVQKEFAERVASQPGPKAYGVPSIRAGLVANTRLGPIFPGDIFHPVANVESQVLELRFLPEPRFEVKDPLHFRHLLAIAFSTRRRKIANTLTSSGQYPAEVIEHVLREIDVSANDRVERITVEQFVKLSNLLYEHSH
jgi:16S rRNA (adenine1518-N6/adenine1519-N6)-dimethyltransferase